jgi:hypothetical protein
VTAALLATVLGSALTVAVAEPAASKTRRAAPPVASYTVSSFNVLGSSHTKPGGKRAVGTTRIVWAKQLLDRRHVDVVGFQELQPDQAEKFAAITGDTWAMWPGLPDWEEGMSEAGWRKRDSENSVAWRTDTFERVDASFVTIPYFNGNERRMPVVLLRHKATGLLAYFSNFHNPADTRKYRRQGKWRAEATRIEIALQRQLTGTGIPRFMTGDMNERASYFCAVTKGSAVKAARGGYWRRNVCNALKPRSVDWIFGSQRLRFSRYLEDRGALVAKTTDHPMIVSDVAVDAAQFPRALPVTTPTPFVPRVTYKRR